MDYVISPINIDADNTKNTDECILINDESENTLISKENETNQILDLDEDCFELDKNSEIITD